MVSSPLQPRVAIRPGRLRQNAGHAWQGKAVLGKAPLLALSDVPIRSCGLKMASYPQTSLQGIPPSHLRPTSDVPPIYLPVSGGRRTEVDRRCDGGTTEVCPAGASPGAGATLFHGIPCRTKHLRASYWEPSACRVGGAPVREPDCAKSWLRHPIHIPYSEPRRGCVTVEDSFPAQFPNWEDISAALHLPLSHVDLRSAYRFGQSPLADGKQRGYGLSGTQVYEDQSDS